MIYYWSYGPFNHVNLVPNNSQKLLDKFQQNFMDSLTMAFSCMQKELSIMSWTGLSFITEEFLIDCRTTSAMNIALWMKLLYVQEESFIIKHVST